MNASLALAAVVATAFVAQPPANDQPEQQSTQDATQADSAQRDERDAVKRRLERRLEQIRDIESQIESAIKKLDEGAEADEIIFAVRPYLDMERRHDDPPPPPPNNPLESAEDVRVFLTEHLPDLATWMADNPEPSARFMDQFIQRLGPIAAIEHTDPPLFQIRLEEYKVGYELLGHRRDFITAAREHGDDSAQADEIKATIAIALERRFNLRLEGIRHELSTVEGRVDHLKSQMAEMEAERSESIARQLDYFTKPHDRRRGPRRDREEGDKEDRRRPAREGG